MDENVVQMPTPLERLAALIKHDLQHCYRGIVKTDEGRRQWKAGAYDLCLHLAEAKDHYPALIEFGQWCDDNGFGANVISYNIRASAIAMAKEPEALRACLEATERNSLETIYRFDFPSFQKILKTPRRKEPAPRRTKVTREMVDEVHRRLEAETPVRHAEIEEMFGAGEKTVSRAVLQAHIEREVSQTFSDIEPIPTAEMAPTIKRRYEAALRKARNELREEIIAEVGASYQLMIDRTRERVARADRIIASHRGVMSRDAFRKIRACLHPDHNTFKFAAEALQTFSELESVLVKSEDTAPVASGLPKTAAELMARRRQHR